MDRLSKNPHMKRVVNIKDSLPFIDEADIKHGFHGHVTIKRRNKLTGETTLWYESDNIIPISGMQWILMKMFGLHLDASHGVPYEKLDQDTNLVIPELNQSGVLGIGTDPTQYTEMADEIGVDHIIQGFMVGNAGSGEDQLTTKNTDYSFIKLRNPIPFQQTQTSLPSEIAGKYMGVLRMGSSEYAKSYYVKKFDSTPHIAHSWWKDGQKWDYVDPVTQDDLGPNAPNGAGKTDRIETYAECELVISEDDFTAYFAHDGNTQTPAINELGLVAFDSTANGDRAIMERVYNRYVKPLINIVFNNNRTEEEVAYMHTLAADAVAAMQEVLQQHSQSNINELYNTLLVIAGATTDDFESYQTQLAADTSIAVEAFYNQYGVYQYEKDTYKEHLADETFNLTDDEAQRIKLITYYTFKSIPIEANWETLINYRIYGN